LRALWVAGIGGLAVGHICWLIGISAAIATSDVPPWVLVVAAVSFVAGIVCVYFGRRAWRKGTPNAEARAVFLWALPVSPVLLSLTVLGVTYL
jgi:hypothetical protein